MISGLPRPLPCFFRYGVTLGIVEGPMRFFADVDPVQRWLGKVDASFLQELRNVPVNERQQQRGNVVAVGVGVGKDDELAVAEPGSDRSSCRARIRAR